MKLLPAACFALFCFVFAASPAAEADDIFSSPAATAKGPVISYPTAAAFLAATRTGEIR